MVEIRFHGRGGQGALTAARILASAFWKEKKYALVLPEFKSERRSAPIIVATRDDEEPIILRSKIYEPDYLIILDASLLRLKKAGILAGFKKEQGLIVINATKESKYLDKLSGYKLGIADVDSISNKYGLGPSALPATGTAILGAFAKATGLVNLESILEAAKESDELPKKEKNLEAIKEAFELAQIIELPASEIIAGEEASRPEIAFKSWRELPQSVISLGDTTKNLTGTWRKIRPYYENKVAPCANACLAGNNIPDWVGLIAQKKYREAYEVLAKTNPFPSLTGRICPHPCETECNRKHFGEALAINSLEEFVGDWGLKNVPEIFPEITKKEKVAIIGSGPAGLSSAYYLRKMGYQLTIFEALPVIGGLMAYGIPEFRLPKKILKAELEKKILVSGVEVKTTSRVSKTAFQIILNCFDVVFAAVGASKTKEIHLAGQEAFGVIDGLNFLRNVNLGVNMNLSSKVLVVGGGNTAIDAARTAKKMNAEVEILYRRTQKEMPALPEEIERARSEGITIRELIIPVEVMSVGGRFDSLECQEASLAEADESGRGKPVPIEGSNFRIEADTLILATGEEVDSSFLPEDWKLQKKIFVGGDANPSAGSRQVGTVAAAIKSGREAADVMSRYLLIGERESVQAESQLKIVKFEDLNTAYFRPQKRRITPVQEAKRCFSCGVCDLCGNCWKFCPHMSIFEKDGELKINYDYCKGCLVCAQECPRGAISKELEV